MQIVKVNIIKNKNLLLYFLFFSEGKMVLRPRTVANELSVIARGI